MLSGDQDVVDGDWDDFATFLLVLNDNLRFAVGSQPWDLSVVSLLSHGLGDLVGQKVRQGEEGIVPLISSISKHETLVSSAQILISFLLVNRLSDFRGL